MMLQGLTPRARAPVLRGHNARMIGRRSLFLLMVGFTIVIGTMHMYSVLTLNGMNAFRWGMLVLFCVLFAPLSVAFWTAVFGFVVRFTGWDALRLTRDLPPLERIGALASRTAVAMPVRNEDPRRVMAGLRAMYESLEATGHLASFDFWVLSDTTDADLWIDEELEFLRLREALGAGSRLNYRKRRHNHERKAGNIGEFCAAEGKRYEYMVVLDADSVMTGESMVKLVHLMETHPEAGIIQTPPMPVNRKTLFGRLQQFAAHAYSPAYLTGFAFWQHGESNYWGHNAIIRIDPFQEHCRLPKLPGREPLGGPILSHDFVEAALMRRAGFRVYLAHDLEGSYEEAPPNLIAYAARDRRWCQGNLQHARLLKTYGLHLMSRIHLLAGIISYVSSPLWMLLLILATSDSVLQELEGHTYFPAEPQLFPTWKISDVLSTSLLFAAVIGMMLLPRLLNVILWMRDPKGLGHFGGAKRFLGGVAVETLGSVLLAPNLAILQSRFVVSILLGRSVSWGGQARDDEGTSLADAVRRHGAGTLIGLVWGGIALAGAPELFWWLLPVVVGLVLSIPISIATSWVRWGEALARRGLLCTPEEIDAPLVLRRLQELLAEQAASDPAPMPALERVLRDQGVRAAHLALLPPFEETDLARHRLTYLRVKYEHEGAGALSSDEVRDLLFSHSSIAALSETTGAGRGEP